MIEDVSLKNISYSHPFLIALPPAIFVQDYGVDLPEAAPLGDRRATWV